MRNGHLAVALVLATLLTGCEAAAVLTHSTDIDPVDAPAGDYTLAQRHADLLFSVEHLGFSHYNARFDSFDATLDFDPAAVQNSHVAVTIDTDSVSTADDEIDGLLKGRNFFDVANYPHITFVSRSITVTGPTTGQIEGDLTIRDITHPVTLDVTYNGGAPSPLEPLHILGFSADGSFSRSAYGLSNWLPAIGDTVTVHIEAEFQQPR